MAASTQRTVRTPDGRTLAIEEAGDPGGRPVLVHNGTPNSRHLYAPAAADAAARGLRLIGYDRPGYGGSTPQPGRTVADCAADVRAICAGLGGPDWDAGCPMCSSVADGFDGIRVRLKHHDVAVVAISRAPVDKLIAYRRRMGWSFP